MRWRGATLGLAAGFIGGLFGVGGGLLVVPGLVLWLHFEQRRASATSLATIVASATAAMTLFWADGSVEFDTAAVIFIGAGVGAAVGARLAGRMPNYWLARGFIVIVVVSVVRLVLVDGDSGTRDALISGSWEPFALVGVGLLAGLLSATLGIGGGVVFVPALVTLFGFEQATGQGTSLAVIVPTALIGTITHARGGRVDWPIGMTAGAGGAAGGLIGAQVALGLPEDVLRRLFAVFLVIIAIRMASRARAPIQPGASSS